MPDHDETDTPVKASPERDYWNRHWEQEAQRAAEADRRARDLTTRPAPSVDSPRRPLFHGLGVVLTLGFALATAEVGYALCAVPNLAGLIYAMRNKEQAK